MAEVIQKIANNPLGSFPCAADELEDGTQARVQYVKLAVGVPGVLDPVTSLNPIPVTGSFSASIATSATSTESIATVTTSSSVVLAANGTRKGGWVKNVSDVYIFVSLSGTAATNAPNRIGPGEVIQLATAAVIYTGAVSAIVAAATAFLEVVEL